MIKIRIIDLLIIIFLLKKIIGITSKTIKIKFKTLKFLDENNKYLIDIFNISQKDISDSLKEKYFYYDLILNNIYTEILIGSPLQKVIGFFSGKSDRFSIINDKYFIKESQYNRKISNTFQNLSNFNIYYNKYKNFCFAQEHFEFESYESNEKIIFDYLKFFLTEDDKYQNNNKNYCALIGLRLNYQDMFIENPKNFIYYLIQYYALKKKLNQEKVLKSFYWTIKFEENNEGYISIGDPPHIYDSKNYENKKFTEFNMQIRYSTLNWAIQFTQIYLTKSNETIFLKKYNIEGHNCVFYPELNIILSTIDYFNLIKKEFFQKFFSLNICFIQKVFISEINSTIIEGFNGAYDLIYCDKKKLSKYGIKEFYEEFPSINFYHNLLNITFMLNAKDLFYEDNIRNKIFFLIGNKNNEIDQWIFGKTFMNKYQFVFNTEMKTLGFYNTLIYNKTEKENNFGFSYMNIIIIIVFIIIIISFLFLIVYHHRKNLIKEKSKVALEMELF